MKIPRKEGGATLVIIALMALGLTAAAALAADAGAMYYKRTQMQAAADAAALAGARGLLDGQNIALNEARRLAEANGYQLDAQDVSFPPGSRVRVHLRERQPIWLGPILGASEPEIAVKSGGELHCVSRSAGLRPWGVPDGQYRRGDEVVLKYGPGDGKRGNFMALAVDGPGARTYFEGVLYGAKSTVAVGDVIPTEPGVIDGPTTRAVEQLIGFDRTSFKEAVELGDRACRIVKIVLLDRQSVERLKGRSDVKVAGFARFYLSHITSRGALYGKFVDRVSDTTVGGTAAQYAVRLVE